MSILQQLMQEISTMEQGAKHNWAIAPNAQTLSGPGGIWNDPAMMDAVINLVPQPRGLFSMLPSFMTDVDAEVYYYITGYRAPADRDDTSGLEACGPCQTVGQEKNCSQKAPWGFKCLDSSQLKLTDYGHRLWRTDPMDQYIVNPPMGNAPMGAPGPTGSGRGNLQDPIDQQFWLMGTEFIWWMNRRAMWYGNPANNVVTADGQPLYQEPYGWTNLINTGHVDERDGVTACRSLDSEVVNWGDINIAASPGLYVRTMTARLRRIWRRAAQTNMMFNPATDGVLTMTEDNLYAHTRIWPCEYATNACQTTIAGVPVASVDTLMLTQTEERLNPDRMFEMKYLPVAGYNVPVVIDDALNETDNGDGTFTSSVYYMPLRIRGNYPAAFTQYFNFGNTKAAPALANRLGIQSPRMTVTDGGRALWMTEAQWACAVIKAMIMPRFILRTPQLAMAINNVRYTVDAHIDSAFDDRPYSRQCGVYAVDLPTNYTPFGDVIQHGPGGGVEVIG